MRKEICDESGYWYGAKAWHQAEQEIDRILLKLVKKYSFKKVKRHRNKLEEIKIG